MKSTASTTERKHENVGERHGLSLPIELEEGAPPMLSRATLAIFSALVIVLLLWANIANVRELSVATGEIAPFGSTRQAAHLEGGIVDDVLVSHGQTVTAGQPLIRLRTENAGGEFDRLEARRTDLELRLERLAAQVTARAPDFSAYKTEWPTMVAEQISVHTSAVEQHRAMMATYVERQASAESEVTKTKVELTSETELLDFARQQLAIQEELIGEGFTSKQSFLEAKASVASAKAKIAGARSRLDQARQALASAIADREGAAAEYQSQIAEERAAAIAQLAEIEEPIASLKDRSDRLTVRAPVAGVVNDLRVDGQGDVVSPGDVVAEITPVGADMMAEVRVAPKDIGHVSVGMKTDVSVTTFDANRYGKIEGEVAHVSADTFIDERTGEAYYVAYISLSDQRIGKGERARALTPGMQVRAEIVTQSRTMMQYLLKPVSRSLDQAFTER